jgi:hypothetical protein
MSPTLEPSGEHKSPTGLVRYAIWHWRDADGLTLIPCDVLSVIVAAKPDPNADCGGPRPLVDFRNRKSVWAITRILQRDGLADKELRLTEKGSVIAFLFRWRIGVRSGHETPHGHRRHSPF